MRRAVFAHLETGPGAALRPGLTWWGWPVPTVLELLVVALLGVSMLLVATFKFQKAD